MRLRRRRLLRGLTAGILAGSLPPIPRSLASEDIYALGKRGNVRIIHETDTHAQYRPVYFREPSVNIGVGQASGRPPHLVGQAFLDHFAIKPGSRMAYATTCLDFAEAAHRYGMLGGFAHAKTLIDHLRAEAGQGASILLDGGDIWQGSWAAQASNGTAMVELSNLLGIEVMTSHWEMTYGEKQFRANLAAFKGTYLAQNVFLSDTAAFNGAPAFDSNSGRVFQPYLVKELGGRRIAIIGQCFPYQPIAHPQRFTPDWTFGIHDQAMQKVVDEARNKQRADAVILLSHNGMDVDLKLASRVRGIDVILGGHTHDCTPTPSVVANAGGKTLVANGGSSGKFIGVLDLEVGKGKVTGVRYDLLPVFPSLLKPDPTVGAKVDEIARRDRAMLDEKLAPVNKVLYRRGNFTGTMDQVICNALLQETDAEIALSPGFRWGPSQVPGDALTMEFLLAHTAMTYPSVYVQEMTGAQLKGVMEDVCDNLFNPDPYVQQGGDMVRLGGMSYACSPAEKIGRRISDMALRNGRPVEAGKSYKVAGWASVTRPQDGKPVWDVVATALRGGLLSKPLVEDRITIRGVAGNPGLLPS